MPKRALTHEDKVFHFSFSDGVTGVVSKHIKNGTLLAIPELETMFAGAGLVPMAIEVNLLPPRHPSYVKNRREFEQNKSVFRKQYAQTYPMPGMQEEDIKRVQKTGNVPAHYPYTCHHLVPLRWGGKNQVENMAFLNHDVHRMVHQVTDAYSAFLANRKIEGRVFLIFPMPAEWNGSKLRIIHDNQALTVTEWERAQAFVQETPVCHVSSETQERLAAALNGVGLFFRTYFKSDHARLFIPGEMRPGQMTSYRLSAADIRPVWTVEPTAEEVQSFLRNIQVSRTTHPRLFSAKQWSDFEAGRIPAGFAMVPAVPFMSEKTAKLRFVLMEQEASETLRRLLWEPVWHRIQVLRKTVGTIVIQQRRWPKIVTMPLVRALVDSNRITARVQKTRYQLGEAEVQTQIEVVHNRDGVVFHLSGHPFVHQPRVLCRLDADKIRSFRSGLPPIHEPEIERAVCRRDAWRLKNIGRAERLRIEKQQRIPADLGVEMRCFIPREWGGSVAIDNMVLMKRAVYASYHRTILMPLAQYVMKNKLSGQIQVMLPQPMEAYLAEPEKQEEKECAKRVKPEVRRCITRHDRRQSKIDLRQEWQYS